MCTFLSSHPTPGGLFSCTYLMHARYRNIATLSSLTSSDMFVAAALNMEEILCLACSRCSESWWKLWSWLVEHILVSSHMLTWGLCDWTPPCLWCIAVFRERKRFAINHDSSHNLKEQRLQNISFLSSKNVMMDLIIERTQLCLHLRSRSWCRIRNHYLRGEKHVCQKYTRSCKKPTQACRPQKSYPTTCNSVQRQAREF